MNYSSVHTPVILIVDDEPHLREILKFQLESAGFQVLQAADGDQGYSVALQSHPDLVLSDIVMPKSDGLRLIKRLRETTATARIPFIFLTAKTTRDEKEVGLLAGANDYITKPWSVRELTLRCRALIDWTRGLVSTSSNSTYFSCFISYTAADDAFVLQLHRDFLSAGVPCWKWDEDAKTGEGLWSEIDRAIRAHDKLVLIASESSLMSPAVNREIERAIQEEDDRAAKRGNGQWNGSVEVLFPVRLDDYIFKGWEHERKPDVLRKVIADARDWRDNTEVYGRVRDRLLRDLRVEV